MLLYFLGSSVTYGSATNGRSFVEELAAQTGWEYVKEAVSGTTLAVQGGDHNSSYVARLKNFNKERRPEKLVVQLSTNDATQNVPLGTLSDGEAYDVKTIIGAIEFIICYAREVWGCEVVFYTNPYFGHTKYEEMIKALYAVRQKQNIGIVDFYYMRNMERLQQETLQSYMNDAIHPNLRGYRWMSNVMLSALSEK